MFSNSFHRLDDQVLQFVEAEEYKMFSRIVFDTAPTVRKPGGVCTIFVKSK